ncbi:MAG: chorismate synthase, partial [Oscillibacter sp.]|nr:chorismate synthase [Oscillibacter sp.]
AAVFGIPAVKGVEFGAGFGAADLRGSDNNDPFAVQNGVVVTETNHSGGILGGITTGMPVVFRAAFKPTPSIGKPQKSVNLQTMEAATLTVSGRHDPCVAHRAVPVVEAVAACVLLDLLLENTALARFDTV